MTQSIRKIEAAESAALKAEARARLIARARKLHAEGERALDIARAIGKSVTFVDRAIKKGVDDVGREGKDGDGDAGR